MKRASLVITIVSVLIYTGCERVEVEVPTSAPAVSNWSAAEISVTDAKSAVENINAQFIDVRTEAEYQNGHAPQALNYPLDRLEQDLVKLDMKRPVYIICQTGNRSQEAVRILREAGFEQVFSIAGGTSAWAAAGFPIDESKGDQKTGLDVRTERALVAALADERRAQATYEAVLEKFGEVRPFSNIVIAEKRHESFLLPLFERYAVRVPESALSRDRIQLPMTLAEACQSAVSGEKANIALYNGFLEFVREPDIRETFIYLRDASKNNHLPAFERCGGVRRGKAF